MKLAAIDPAVLIGKCSASGVISVTSAPASIPAPTVGGKKAEKRRVRKNTIRRFMVQELLTGIREKAGHMERPWSAAHLIRSPPSKIKVTVRLMIPTEEIAR